MHPIFQWLDYRYKDYGGFAKVTDDRNIGGFRNVLVAGVNVINGTIDNAAICQYRRPEGRAAVLVGRQSRKTLRSMSENSFYFLPNVAVVAGTQFLYATRDRRDRFLERWRSIGPQHEFNLWSPKAGLLWDIDPTWQAYANISRSAEVPSFGESVRMYRTSRSSRSPASGRRRATTYEIGTRGRRPDLTWELTGYRADIKDELLCLYSAFGNCNVTNAIAPIHQGIEAGLGAAIFKGHVRPRAAPDKVWVNLAYTFNDFRFDNDPVFGNNQLPGAPRHYLRAELLYKHPTGIYVGPNVEWVPESYYVDSANTLKTSAYALVGLKAGVDNGGTYSMYIEARNIANKAYISSASIIDRANPNLPLFEPGTGRAVYAGVKARW